VQSQVFLCALRHVDDMVRAGRVAWVLEWVVASMIAIIRPASASAFPNASLCERGEDADDMAMQRPHDGRSREHRRAATSDEH